MRRCVPYEEQAGILHHCYLSPHNGHYGENRIAAKVLQYGFHWPNLFKDAQQFSKNCDRCQSLENITQMHEMNNILETELFNIWDKDCNAPEPTLARCATWLTLTPRIYKK